MRRWLFLTVVLLVVVSWVPLALIAYMRSTTSRKPAFHVVFDMDNQEKFKPQQMNAMFADLRAMRPQVPGTIARGQLMEDAHLYEGKVNGEWAKTFPIEVTETVMGRGRERFGVFCAPCHGLSGDGAGMVSVRAEELREGSWVPPTALFSQTVLERPVGHLFNTITNGIRNMPAYGKQVDVMDRWAIVAYVLALQRSHGASVNDVPADVRPSLR